MSEVEVEFNYNGNMTIIQCRKDEKMEDIFNKYLLEVTNLDINKIYFIYSGNII
jgi:predicted ATP-grasp superfamily ATP-dependent carboligase